MLASASRPARLRACPAAGRPRRLLAAPRPAARPPRRVGLVCRAYKSASEDEAPDFHELAKTVAGQLASSLAGSDDAFSRLQSWLQGASASESSAGEGGGEGAEAGSKGGAVLRRAVGAADDYLTSPKGDAPGSGVGASVGQSASSSLGALGHLASEVLGSPRTDQPGHQTDSSLLSSLAADYLGLHSFNIDSVKSWLSNPSQFEERNDSKMVGAIVHRLLQSFEDHTGESFEGREHQYDWLWNQAKAVLGSNITRGLVKRLVKAYLGIPLR